MFESVTLNIILLMSIRFFLFDFYLFKPIWKYICQKWDNSLITHFFNCPFCQGFWLGLFYSMYFMKIDILYNLSFGFISGFINYVYYYL